MIESRLVVTWGCREDAKGHKETFMVVGDGYVSHLDCGIVSLVYTSKLIKWYALNMCRLYISVINLFLTNVEFDPKTYWNIFLRV